MSATLTSATLTVLGAGAILPQPGRGPAGYALRPAPGAPVTLLDCGPGSVRMLGAVGIGVEEVERVVLSHYHLDHCLDLFALFFARHNPGLAQRPELELIGPVGLAHLLAEAPRALGRWARDVDARVVEVPDRGRSDVLERGALRLTSQANGHTDPAVSWSVELGTGPDSGARLVYSGDTDDDPGLPELARDADLFLCECSFPEGAGTPNHLTPRQAGRIAARAGVRTLLLTHFYPGTDPEASRAAAGEEFGGRIELAADGSVHPLGRSGML